MKLEFSGQIFEKS